MPVLPSRLVWTAALTTITVTPATAQDVWGRPEPPCELSTSHRLINGAVLQLKQGVEAESEEQRQSRLMEGGNLLLEAIVDAGQVENPSAWYYLGRYYAKMQNARGADSAFRRAEALAPECAADIARYRTPLSAVAMNDAAMAWQAGHTDSAATLFLLAADLDTTNANAPLFLGSMYAGTGQLDSAEKYVELGNRVAGDNPTYRNRRQRALLDVVRGYVGRAAEEPAVGRASATRFTRDSLGRVILRDSTILANLLAEWSGRNLRPAVRQRVQRDSARVAQRLAQARSRHSAAVEAAAADSVAALRVVEPAIRAQEAYLAAFPGDHPIEAELVSHYATIGHIEAMQRAIDRMAAAEDVETRTLIQTGLDLLNGGQADGSAYLMETVITRNPYARDGLFVLAQALYRMRSGDRLMEVAPRLIDLDPLNQQSLRMVAAAWDLAGQRDSVTKYVNLANGGIGWNVRVTQFLPSGNSSIINGQVANIAKTAQPAMTLQFEFLGPGGQAVTSASTEIPALAPGAQHMISLSVPVGDTVGWRYRKQ